MSFTFFATNADLLQLALSLLDDPDLLLFEAYSQPGKPNRWFGDAGEIAPFFEEGPYSFSIWAKSTGARPRAHSVIFTEDVQRQLGATGRTVLHSPSAIGVHRNGDQLGCLASSQMNCWTERGARQRSILPDDLLDSVDWKAMRKVTGRIQRTIKKMSVAKLNAYPIMPNAFSRMESGEQDLWGWGEPVKRTSPGISIS